MLQRFLIPCLLLSLAVVAAGQSPVETQPDEAPAVAAPDATEENSKALPPAQPASPGVTVPPQPRPQTQPANQGEQPLSVQQQLAIFDQLQQRILKLQVELQEAKKQNERFRQSLIESRDTAGRLQSEVNRAAVVQEIQRREIEELRQRLARASRPESADEAAPATLNEEEDEQRVDALVEVGRLRRLNEKLELQLKLAAIEDPDEKARKLLAQLQETNETLQKVEALRRQLSSLVVKQADEIRLLRERQEALDKQIRDLQASPPPAVVAATTQPVTLPAPPAVTTQPAEAKTPPADTASTQPADEPADTTEVAPAKPKRLHGKLTDVNDITIVINAGRDKGVQKGMRLIVYRDDKFIGYLDIVEVRDEEAAGTMNQRIRDPQVGDSVIDRLE
jgi:hypothetical protein